MVSPLSCFLLFGIVILTNGKNNYDNEKSEDLIQNLSNLKSKYDLNFLNIEGTRSLLNKFKQTHPKMHYIEPDDPQFKQVDNTLEIYNPIEQFNLLVAMNKRKAEADSKDQLTRKKSLRICKKAPKVLQCSSPNCESEEKKKEEIKIESEELCGSNNNKKDEKKRYYRAGNNKKHFTDDETTKSLNDLEKLLAKNGKYKIFLGCVGDMCGRSNRARYVEERDNTEVEREYQGCTGDRCGGSRDDEDDIYVRRRY